MLYFGNFLAYVLPDRMLREMIRHDQAKGRKDLPDITLDDLDRKLLRLVQRDARLPTQALAEAAAIPTTATTV